MKDNRSGLRQVSGSRQMREKLHADIVSRMNEAGWTDLSFVSLAAGRTHWIGKTLAQVPVVAQNLTQKVENLIDISLRGRAQAVYAIWMTRTLPKSQAMLIAFSDPTVLCETTAECLPHPRGCGTFPRIFKRYVLEQGLLSMTAAVHKANGKAAGAFQLRNRGVLKSGYWADVVVFDASKIEDRADYDQPFAPPLGIDYVIVNGVVAVDHGNVTSNSPSGMPVAFR